MNNEDSYILKTVKNNTGAARGVQIVLQNINKIYLKIFSRSTLNTICEITKQSSLDSVDCYNFDPRLNTGAKRGDQDLTTK